jgi:NAD(P) transhydrogenase subunit beta
VTLLASSITDPPDYIRLLYIVAFVLFILGMRQVTSPVTARRGNATAAVGMAIAVIATLLIPEVGNYGLIIIGIALGTAVGVPAARRVQMTDMPQMVALFNGVGGGAVALISWAEYRHALAGPFGGNPEASVLIPILFAAIIGSVSFWGSNIAFGKLQDILPQRPVSVPGQQIVNLIVLAIALGCAIAIAAGSESEGLFVLILLSAAVLGNMVVLPIGGADMPVVISLLNALTGLSAAAAGIALNNVALIVGGIIVGASGSILTNLMAEAMNRSIPSIVAGGFGGVTITPGAEDGEEKIYRSTDAASVAMQLSYANSVVVAPGYGMAVAQAQHTVRELADELEKKGVTVSYAIHPVAGRMPGHMNVLLAEADVPYDSLKEMDEINPEFGQTDVTLVIGANDVTNPAARTNEGSPIYGMPILDVDKSEQVVVLKRSMNTGFAGIDNPLFYNENTQLLFGDAKQSVADVLAAVKEL